MSEYEKEPSSLGLALSIIPSLTGTISFLSSIALVWSIFREKKIHRPREGILIGLSVLDMSFSSACAMSTFAAPKDIDPYTEYILRGNIATCDMQGWLYQFGSAAPIYNSVLSIYCLLCVKYGWTDARAKKCYLPSMHTIVVGWAFGSATAGLVLQLYNYGGYLGCWIDDSHLNYCVNAPDLSSCSRGEHSDLYVFLFAVLPGLSSLFVTVFATVMLYCSIRALERRAQQYDDDATGYAHATRSSRFVADDIPLDIDQNITESLEPSSSSCCRLTRSTHSRMSKKVLESGMLYVLAFWITYTPFLVIVGLNVAEISTPDFLKVANVVLLPLQGLFNLLIYKLPVLKQGWSKATATTAAQVEMRETRTSTNAVSSNDEVVGSQYESALDSPSSSEGGSAPTMGRRSDFAENCANDLVPNDRN